MTINEFYKELQQEIKTTQLTEEEGGTQEQIFTQFALDLITEAGETEDSRICFDRKEDAIGRTMHKINGYSLSDNYETLDLFVTIYKGLDEIETITKQEAETSINQVEKFFRNAVYKDYLNELEESSEVFDLAHTLADMPEVKEFLARVNLFILSNGRFKSALPVPKTISGYNIFHRIIDIEYLFNISNHSRIPIEINFGDYGGGLPCLVSPSSNDEYESYLALMPGITLARIYEEYGSRLLEQNVRSFLQFTGKINKGIRATIRNKPHMFLAFNNGIAATAEEIKFNGESENGKNIFWAKDFQIVNGGQTTASIFHTWKKDKADIDKIFVQIKLTVVKKRDSFDQIVNQIAEYANTQNKVSTSDLSSNTPFHIELEKLSRSIWAPPIGTDSLQTKWFYERARGQYKNARNSEGFTPSRRKAFDLRTPRNQMITKELLAKYVNTFREVYYGNKLLIGPHIVVRGSQKNYAQFLNHCITDKPDSIFFEDLVAKAIVFKSAERRYGIKPNSIGDMRYITVPYSVAWLSLKTQYRIDLYKIWKNQYISKIMDNLLYEIMIHIDRYITENAPGSLYGEWAKKEECWDKIKNEDFGFDLSVLKADLGKGESKRKFLNKEEIDNIEVENQLDRIKAIPPSIWRKIEKWGYDSKAFSPSQQSLAFNLINKIRRGSSISATDRIRTIEIIDIVIDQAPDLLFEIDTLETEPRISDEEMIEVTMDLIEKMVAWDKKHKKLQDHHFRFMMNVITKKTPITNRIKQYALANYKLLKRHGFKND